jgi:uncharacterized membrane protein YbaN (DUF454 family)
MYSTIRKIGPRFVILYEIMQDRESMYVYVIYGIFLSVLFSDVFSLTNLANKSRRSHRIVFHFFFQERFRAYTSTYLL